MARYYIQFCYSQVVFFCSLRFTPEAGSVNRQTLMFMNRDKPTDKSNSGVAKIATSQPNTLTSTSALAETNSSKYASPDSDTEISTAETSKSEISSDISTDKILTTKTSDITTVETSVAGISERENPEAENVKIEMSDISKFNDKELYDLVKVSLAEGLSFISITGVLK